MPEERALSQVRDEDEEEECSSSPNDSEYEHETSDSKELEMKVSNKKSLLEFRCKVEDAILGNYIYGPRGNARNKENLKDISLWGVPLLPTKVHKGTDIVLMKFLKAKDFKVSDAFSMLSKMMKWRRDFKVDGILNEKMSPEFDTMWNMNGTDKEGRPVCYLSFRDLQNRDFKKKLFQGRWEIRRVFEMEDSVYRKGNTETGFCSWRNDLFFSDIGL